MRALSVTALFIKSSWFIQQFIIYYSCWWVCNSHFVIYLSVQHARWSMDDIASIRMPHNSIGVHIMVDFESTPSGCDGIIHRAIEVIDSLWAGREKYVRYMCYDVTELLNEFLMMLLSKSLLILCHWTINRLSSNCITYFHNYYTVRQKKFFCLHMGTFGARF